MQEIASTTFFLGTVLGALAVSVSSLILCGKERTPPQKKPPPKSSKIPEGEYTNTPTKTSMTKETSSTSKLQTSQLAKKDPSKKDVSTRTSTKTLPNPPEKRTPPKILHSQKQLSLPLQKEKTKTAEDTKEYTLPSNSDYQVSNTQRESRSERSVKSKKVSTKETQISCDVTQSNRQLSPSLGPTQTSTKETQNETSQNPYSYTSPVHPILGPNQAPALPRDVNRDRERAAKALFIIRARRAQNSVTNRERAQTDNSIKDQSEEPPEPQLRDPNEKAEILTDDEVEKDTPKPAGGKSTTFPTVDTPDIAPGEEKNAGTSPKQDNADDDEEAEESKREQSGKRKTITAYPPIFVSPDQRQYRPVSEIPADDLTIKRKVKKKKHKKKNKKNSDKS